MSPRSTTPTAHREIAIVGGGPAGLSAALVLGRARRHVVVLDGGGYRNAAAHQLRGFLTRDGVPPDELRRLARHELARYPSVELRDVEVEDARRTEHGFELDLVGGERLTARLLLLATGLVDNLPAIEGAAELHGVSVLPCPYCDGWEVKDEPLAVYAPGDDGGVRYALTIAQWSRDVVFVPAGGELDAACHRRLAQRDIRVEPRRLRAVERAGDGLVLALDGATPLWRRALFYHLGAHPQSNLARRLGCAFEASGGIQVDRHARTCVPGLFVAGDASRDVLLAIVAAGEGAAAAVTMNGELTRSEATP